MCTHTVGDSAYMSKLATSYNKDSTGFLSASEFIDEGFLTRNPSHHFCKLTVVDSKNCQLKPGPNANLVINTT